MVVTGLGCGVGGAFASDLPPAVDKQSIRTAVFDPDIYRSDRFEIRGGGFYHCCFVETGSPAFGLELVTPRPFTLPGIHEFFIPRLHLGGVVDTGGHTSYGFAGLLFTYNITKRFFFEPFIGVAFSNGKALGDADHNAIGCTTLIHSGANVGYRLDDRWSVMLSVDHISNGNICSRNVGVNNYGGKIGYSF